MKRRKKNREWEINQSFVIAFLVGALLVLVLSLLLFYQQRKKEIERDLSVKLEGIKESCQKYNDYQVSIVTENLQNLIDKANSIKDFVTKAPEGMEDSLREYVKDQNITGLILLDENLQVEKAIVEEGQDIEKLVAKIRSSKDMSDILQYSKKVFADHVNLEERTYEYVLISRTRSKGVLLCYLDTTEYEKDKYALSLSNMLLTGINDEDETLVVSDGERVVCSNRPLFHGKKVSECPLSDVVSKDLIPENHNLIKVKYDGLEWYGKYDMCRSYYVYLFYQTNLIDSLTLSRMVMAMCIYLLLFFAFEMYRQKQKKEKIRLMEKEYYMLTAIASIYDVNVLIHLEENTWEVILQTTAMERAVLGIEKADEMLQVFCEKLMMESAREKFLQFVDFSNIQERFQGKQFLGYTFEAVTGRWYQALLIPETFDTENSITKVMLLIRDVTEQKKKEMDYQEQLRESAEKEATANAAKTDFLRRMTHDIRTPINGIRGMTTMGMASAEDKDQIKSCFQKIQKASDFLLELVNNVLDMSKIEAGEIEKEHISFDLRELLEETIHIVSLQAKEMEIEICNREPEGQHWKLVGSPINIQRIFQNIISNGIKYGKKGGRVEVALQELSCKDNKATFRFICQDDGIGMSEEFKERAYDIFSQEHKTARTNYTGSGLGLSIVKKTVDLLGGNVSFETEEGVGTTFIIELPLQLDLEHDRIESEKIEAAEADQTRKIGGIHILLAEDNELNMEIATYMLEEKGAVVIPAKNGKEAVELFAASAPGTIDVILMDIMMPVMDGLEATNTIRQMEREDAKSIPIIAISANAFADDIEQSQACGMNAHLSKPLDYEKVCETICFSIHAER